MSPYHRGELVAQARAGLSEEAAHVAALINDQVPPVAAAFLAEQPMLLISAAGPTGNVWITMLTGAPGLIRVTGPSTLEVASGPRFGDPLREVLAEPTLVGLLAIDPGTRRRVRMNGTAHPLGDGLRFELDQIYANCPKYIQRRAPELTTSDPALPRASAHLTDADLSLVETTDTFFVASADLERHADASHRGGNPGFLRALSPTHLRWPDYVGNSMFNTFGNFEINPRAGLLVPDWATGAFVHMTGTASVDWDPSHAAAVPGAQRLVNFTVEQVIRVENASRLRWNAPESSRFNPPVTF